jgi:diguanylate cyclase (GGDEF)-like protein/PAS domain S-box-containing protein
MSRTLIELGQAQQQLRITAATFETHEAIQIMDADVNIIRVNKAFEKITGYTEGEVLGKNPRILKAGCYDKQFYEQMWGELLKSGNWNGELLDRRKNGEIYPQRITISAIKDGDFKTTQYVAMFSDISEQKKTEEKIYNLAFYDALTGLPNRQLLLDRLEATQLASARNKQYGALLFLEVGNLKLLNESMGHEYGDMLLMEAAKRLKARLRKVDTVARYGGNEYMLLLQNIGTSEHEASYHATTVAQKICDALVEPFHLRKHVHHSKTSIGVTLFYGNDDRMEELVKRVDIAMHQAKKTVQNKVQFFDAQMQKLIETRAEIEADLHRALSSNQFFMVYQIQVDRQLRPIGAEALIRWEHPRRGMVSPLEFIPIAEESALIIEIGKWVLDAACRQLASWSKNEKTRDLELSVNISARQFKQPNFVEQIAGPIRKYQINASRLKLELTESVALEDVEDVMRKMETLRKDVGVTLSLDDFGTGYSSLSYLRQLPLDQIKIDRGFMRNIALEVSEAVMVKTIIDMALNFELHVIAEGVETEDQLNFLMQNGCLAFQGYYFSKPVAVEEFEALLTK